MSLIKNKKLANSKILKIGGKKGSLNIILKNTKL
jgi:hypothetical protein